MFNNRIGLSYKKETENEIHLNLQTDLLDQFDYTLYMRFKDEIFCKSKNNGKEIIHKAEPGRPYTDVMVGDKGTTEMRILCMTWTQSVEAVGLLC